MPNINPDEIDNINAGIHIPKNPRVKIAERIAVLNKDK